MNASYNCPTGFVFRAIFSILNKNLTRLYLHFSHSQFTTIKCIAQVQFISKIIIWRAFSLRVITVMSEKKVANQITRLSTYFKNRVIWMVTVFSDVIVVTRSERAGRRIIFDILQNFSWNIHFFINRTCPFNSTSNWWIYFFFSGTSLL